MSTLQFLHRNKVNYEPTVLQIKIDKKCANVHLAINMIVVIFSQKNPDILLNIKELFMLPPLAQLPLKRAKAGR